MKRSELNIITSTAITLGLSLALVTAPVSARGPKASVNSATACALYLGADGSDDANWVITTTLTNKSSGGIVAELRDGSQIQGTFKKMLHYKTIPAANDQCVVALAANEVSLDRFYITHICYSCLCVLFASIRRA